MSKRPTYQELLEDIEMLKLAIKLEEDPDVREKLELELLYAEEYLEKTINKGRE